MIKVSPAAGFPLDFHSILIEESGHAERKLHE